MDFQIVEVIDETTVAVSEIAPAEVISVGTQGPGGPATIGGYAINLHATTAGDVLMFGNENSWVNTPKTQLTDGGNF